MSCKKRRKPLDFIQITDLHLDDPAASCQATNHANLIVACLASMADHTSDAEFCVITGYLTNHGDIAAYSWLKTALNTLPMPVVLILGNHDDRPAFLSVFAGQGHDDGGFVQRSMSVRGVRFLILDTHCPDSDAGVLCPQRLNWLDRQLADAGDVPVTLFMHHPPCDIGDPKLDAIKLTNAEAFSAVLQRHGTVRHIVFGHVHRTMFVNWRGIACTSLSNIAATRRAATCPVAFGSCVAKRLRITYHDLPVNVPDVSA